MGGDEDVEGQTSISSKKLDEESVKDRHPSESKQEEQESEKTYLADFEVNTQVKNPKELCSKNSLSYITL